MMKLIIQFALILFVANSNLNAQTAIDYGNNKEVGKFVHVNGIDMYYEVYGSGEPIILIHGNKTGIKSWKPQLDFFAKKYKVYVLDCRGRGKSALGNDSLTYNQIASDINAFIVLNKLDSVVLVGKSDGAIISLIMGFTYPAHIKKIISFGANIKYDTTALYAQTVNEIKKDRRLADLMLAKKDTTKNWKVEQQRNRMMEYQPNINVADLKKINIPVLVMSCDRDVIKEEHSLFIYKNIPKANLCIMPGEVHRFPTLNADLFNAIVDNFITKPFVPQMNRFQ